MQTLKILALITVATLKMLMLKLGIFGLRFPFSLEEKVSS